MDHDRSDQIAVIFTSRRTAADEAGYARAAATMDTLAAAQPGYRGIDSAQGPGGFGITVSWWSDEAAAIAWRGHPVYARIRAGDRECWYATFEVAVARVERSYGWPA